MSSCVMIVSEFSNRIEAIFSYQTPVEVCTVSKTKQKNMWAWKSQNIKQQRASNEK